jgi:hypothetical protein
MADSSGAIYLTGGYSHSSHPLDTDRFDPATGWTTGLEALSPPRWYLAGARGPDGNLYVVGGSLANTGGKPTGELQAYSPGCACWSN